MRRIAILGGTFDPPHEGHQKLLNQVIDKLALDGAVVIPSADPPHKSEQVTTPFADRLAMTRLAFASMPNVQVSDIESTRPGPSYSVDTLMDLQRLQPDWSLYFITGGDSYHAFTSWNRWQLILNLACLVVTNRPGFSLSGNEALDKAAAKSQKGMMILQIQPIFVSSTKLRKQLREGETSLPYLSEDVSLYIHKRQLYKES